MLDGAVKERYKEVWAECHLGDENEALKDGTCDTCYLHAGEEIYEDVLRVYGQEAALNTPSIFEWLQFKEDYDNG